jgi:hypothetical protein
LLKHWADPRHPYAERFENKTKAWVEIVLNSTAAEDDALDASFREIGQSLRSVVREIPPVFGSFW